MDKRDIDYLKEIHNELVLIRIELQKSNLQEKVQFITENQTVLSAAVEVGSIIMAAAIFLLTIPLFDIPYLTYEALISLVAISELSFICATTYYIRGSNPEHDKDIIKYFNRKGDLFLAIGWIFLFILPIFLVQTRSLIITTVVGIIYLGIIIGSLFADQIATYALKLIIYAIYYNSFKLASNRARTEGRTNVDRIIITTYYFVSIIAFVMLLIKR